MAAMKFAVGSASLGPVRLARAGCCYGFSAPIPLLLLARRPAHFARAPEHPDGDLLSRARLAVPALVCHTLDGVDKRREALLVILPETLGRTEALTSISGLRGKVAAQRNLVFARAASARFRERLQLLR